MREERWAQLIATGLLRALGYGGGLSPAAEATSAAAFATGAAVSLRTAAPGLYLPELRDDDVARIVPAGTTIGRLIDPVMNATLEAYTAPFVRTLVMLLRPILAVMEGGEMVCVLAEADAIVEAPTTKAERIQVACKRVALAASIIAAIDAPSRPNTCNVGSAISVSRIEETSPP